MQYNVFVSFTEFEAVHLLAYGEHKKYVEQLISLFRTRATRRQIPIYINLI